MSEQLKVEAAYHDGKLVGWRLTAMGDQLIVFNRDDWLKGFRCGDFPRSSDGTPVEYRECNIDPRTIA